MDRRARDEGDHECDEGTVGSLRAELGPGLAQSGTRETGAEDRLVHTVTEAAELPERI